MNLVLLDQLQVHVLGPLCGGIPRAAPLDLKAAEHLPVEGQLKINEATSKGRWLVHLGFNLVPQASEVLGEFVTQCVALRPIDLRLRQ